MTLAQRRSFGARWSIEAGDETRSAGLRVICSGRAGLLPRAYAPLFQGLRTTFSCVFEGFSRELSSNHIINTNCNALYSPIIYRKVATV